MRHFFFNIFNKRENNIDHVVNVALEHMQRKYRLEFHSKAIEYSVDII